MYPPIAYTVYGILSQAHRQCSIALDNRIKVTTRPAYFST